MTARRNWGLLNVKWVAKGGPGESMRGGSPFIGGGRGFGGLPLENVQEIKGVLVHSDFFFFFFL